MQTDKKSNKSGISTKNLGDSRLDTNVLKDTYTQFTEKAKQKLLKLKKEIQEIETDNKNMENDEKEVKIKLEKVKMIETTIDDKLTVAKHQLMHESKRGLDLVRQKKDLLAQVERKKNDIFHRKLDSTHKLEQTLKASGVITEIKAITEKEIERKLETEKEKGEKLGKAIELLTSDIAHLQGLIEGISSSANARNKVINKETADMQKFLSEI